MPKKRWWESDVLTKIKRQIIISSTNGVINEITAWKIFLPWKLKDTPLIWEFTLFLVWLSNRRFSYEKRFRWFSCFWIQKMFYHSSLLYDSKKWVIIMTSSIDESLRESKNRKSGFIQSGYIFIEKNLMIQRSWIKIKGIYATRNFTDHQISQEIVHMI